MSQAASNIVATCASVSVPSQADTINTDFSSEKNSLEYETSEEENETDFSSEKNSLEYETSEEENETDTLMLESKKRKRRSDICGRCCEDLEFDEEKTQMAFVQMIAKHDYPYDMFEQGHFQELVKSINPMVNFYAMKYTVPEDVMRVYNEMKVDLQEVLIGLSSRVSLTTDIWTSELQDKSYCCVTCHYIDSDWMLHNRVIAYEMVSMPFGGNVISEIIKSQVVSWNIEYNLFAIVVDNASGNDAMVQNLKKWLQSKGALPLTSDLFHMQCTTDIFNLLVEDGFKVVDDLLGKIRDSITFSKSSESRKQKFENALADTMLAGNDISYDVSTKWDSTYLMLKSAIEIRLAFERLAELDSDYEHLPSPEEWEVGKVICDCLKVIYEATLSFSRFKYPMANLYFIGVIDVYSSILKWESSEQDYIRDMAYKMKDKFENFWSTCSITMSIGMVFDPRYKFAFVEFACNEFYGGDSQRYINKVFQSLNELYSSYKMYYGSSMDQLSNSSVVDLDPSSGKSYSNVTSKIGNKFWSFQKQHFANLQVQKTELEKYLQEDLFPLSEDERSFDILIWWKINGPKFPTLARMARDILAVPGSTLATESVFSCGGRVISKNRSSLDPDLVEALSCIKNWLPSLRTKCSPSDESSVGNE